MLEIIPPNYNDTTNMVAWYPLDVNGTTTPDAIGYNTGTFDITPTTVTGKVTNGVSFGPGTNFINESLASNFFGGATQLTIMAWVWVNSLSTGDDVIGFDIPANTGNYRFGLQFFDVATYLLACNGSSGYYTAASLPVNQWVHVAVVYNGAASPVWTIYTNGVFMKLTATNGTIATSMPSAANLPNFFVGEGTAVTGFTTNDDVRVYNVAKTAAQVYYTYTNTSNFISPPVSVPLFQSVAQAEPYVSNLWMFNNTSTESPLVDLITSNYTTIPSGMTIGQPGAFLNSSTSAGVTNCVMRLWSSLVGNMEYTAPWTMEFIIDPIGIPVALSGNNYYLFSKYTSAFAGYGVVLGTEPGAAYAQTRDTSKLNSTARLLTSSEIYDGTEGWDVANTDTLTSNTWHHVVVTYQYSNSLPYFRVWIDGAPSQMTTNQLAGPVPTTIINSIVPSLLGSTNSSAHDFSGLVQAIAIYGTNLSGQKIVQHYLAYTGQQTNWQNNFLPSPFSVEDFTDTSGNALHLQNMNALWLASSNYWLAFGFNLTNKDFPCSLTPYFDQTNNQYIGYTSPNLVTFTNQGAVLDVSQSAGAPNVIEMVRVSILTNTTSGIIAWGKMIQTNYVGNNQHAFCATSSIVGAPNFYLVTTNLSVNGTAASGDGQLFQDTYAAGGGQYYVYTLYSGETINITAISANGLTTSGSATTVSSGGDGGGFYYEAPAMAHIGSYYHIFVSYQNFYNSLPNGGYGGMKDVIDFIASSALGTYTSNQSIYINTGNPYGTPFECQGTQIIQNPVSGNWYFIGDNWHNGYLARSSLVFQKLVVSGSSVTVAGITNLLCTFQ